MSWERQAFGTDALVKQVGVHLRSSPSTSLGRPCACCCQVSAARPLVLEQQPRPLAQEWATPQEGEAATQTSVARTEAAPERHTCRSGSLHMVPARGQQDTRVKHLAPR